MPPNRRICLAAISCPGCVRQARVEHLRHRRVPAAGTRRSARRCRSAGPSVRPRVLMPRRVSQASNGPLTAPIAFWWNASSSPSAVVGDDQRATDHVGVPADVLGGGVHHHVRAERAAAAAGTARRRCCRPPAARRASCASPASAAMSAMPSSGLVGVSTQIDLGVPGRIAARTASTSADGAGGPVQAPALGDLGEQPVRAAVRVVRDDHVIAGPAHRPQQRVLGGQPAGEGQPAPAALERGQALLQRVPGRVAGRGCTRSPAGARRRRPARTCWSGRSAAPPRRCAGPGSWPAWMARVSKPYVVERVMARARLVVAAGGRELRLLCDRGGRSAGVHGGRRARTGWRSSTPARCSRGTCWWCRGRTW